MILVAFGTRPEWIKIKPVLEQFRRAKVPYTILSTGQHCDIIDKSVRHHNIGYLRIPTQHNRLDDILAAVINNGDKIYENVRHVLVQGDTTSAFAIALSAFHRKLNIIHLEAGLRSWDMNNPYPEEFNRVSISNMANIHLCPTKANAKVIKNNHQGKVFVVGNTVLDNLIHIKPSLGNTVFITMHRRENINIMKDWFESLEKIAESRKDLKFLFPMHPNPEIRKHKNILKHIEVVGPMSYNDCVSELAKCALVITDSGGLQEESSFLKKKCIVCRKTTERTEGDGIFAQMCKDPSKLYDMFNNTKMELVNEKCPYGNGDASKKILKIIKKETYKDEAIYHT